MKACQKLLPTLTSRYPYIDKVLSHLNLRKVPILSGSAATYFDLRTCSTHIISESHSVGVCFYLWKTSKRPQGTQGCRKDQQTSSSAAQVSLGSKSAVPACGASACLALSYLTSSVTILLGVHRVA